MGRWVRWQGSGLELREGRVSLEGLGECHAILGAEVVAGEAAQTAKEGEKDECSERVCCAAVTAWAGGFDGRAAHRSILRVVLTLSASAIAMPPSGPRLFHSRLRKRERKGRKGQCTSGSLARMPTPALGSRAGLAART